MFQHSAEHHIAIDITERFTFSNKKPNLQVVEAEEKGVFNFHFPANAEGTEGFDLAVRVLQHIQQGSTDASQLPPLVSIPAAVRYTTNQRTEAPHTPLTPRLPCRTPQ